jgi:hypothetical protein
MHWEEGYYWQEEDFERAWCMQCKNTCDEGEELFLHECAWDSARFDFLEVGASDEIQIQAFGSTSLCLERLNNAISLEPCDATNVLQRWTASDGSFTGAQFEISQTYEGQDYCTTTHHHPKYGEIVELHLCSVARFDTTSFWSTF